MAGKTFVQMQAEVRAVNESVGWWDQPVPWKQSMALLHSEISEALEAWRQWGLRDTTVMHQADSERARQVPAKPEGFPSEMADVLIRMLDDAERYAIQVRESIWSGEAGVSEQGQTLPEDLDDLHNLVSTLSRWAFSGLDIGSAFGMVLISLRRVCDKYGIDLVSEYERKLAYNATRAYRHGGKLA